MNIINEESILALLETKDRDELITIIKNMVAYQMRMKMNLEVEVISDLVKNMGEEE
tara:strand:+ start:193 stop:360 length:168 start_codon:yes stop_codon:yes gene_type:complete